MSLSSSFPDPSVLLSFRAANVRSFRDEMELSLLATAVSEPGVRRSVPWREGGKEIDILPVAGLFGSNASGKSNALRAMADMRGFVLNSFRHGRPGGGLPSYAFRLDPAALGRPSSFEVDIVLNGIRHQYGFTADAERILEEWAIRFPKGRAVTLFHRTMDDLELGTAERAKSRAVRELLRPNALFLSTAASANHPLLLPLYSWFERNLLLAEASSRDARQAWTTELLGDPVFSEQVLTFLKAADLGIAGAVQHELDARDKERLERMVKAFFEDDERADELAPPLLEEVHRVQLLHQGSQAAVEFDVSDESAGTLVWFGLAGPVIAALSAGAVLLADELDASLHPVLVAHLIWLFQDPKTNPRRAQLIFNSHDTTILGDSAAERASGAATRLLGRDQIWFTEKSNDGATRLYPLTDLDPRKDEAIERRYLAGRYGATPIVSRSRLAASATAVADGTER